MDPNNPNVVNPAVVTTPQASGAGNPAGGQGLPVAPTVTPTSDGSTPGAPGSKTPSELLLKSLQEERDKVRKLEEELANRPTSPGEAWSDEGKLLQAEIDKLKTTISSFEQTNIKKQLQDSNPILKDKWNDFEVYLLKPENKGMSISTAARSYLIENGMYDTPRVGLETPSGGPRTPVTGALSAEEIKRIRETDPAKYRDMLEKKQIII